MSQPVIKGHIENCGCKACGMWRAYLQGAPVRAYKPIPYACIRDSQFVRFDQMHPEIET